MTIETLLNKLKKRGFNLESTHMSDKNKLEKLLGLVNIAYVLIFLTGEEIKRTYTVIFAEKGKRARSSFDRGLKYLRSLLSNIQQIKEDLLNMINLLSCV